MNKLYIDTCTGELLVGIKTDDQTHCFDDLTARKTAEAMFPVIQDLLQQSKLTLSDIDAIYVTKGPGSYTGSRLGLTFAKILKVLHPDLIVYTCSTLQALLVTYGKADGLALIDARNQAFFASSNSRDADDCDRLEYSEVVNLISRGLTPVIYHLELSSSLSLQKYSPKKVNPLEGMIKHESIFCEIQDVNNIKPFYLKGHGRE